MVVSGQFLLDSESALRESFRKLERLQLPLDLLALSDTEMAMVDHLVDGALYLHEALVDGYEVDPNGVFCRRRLTISPEQQLRQGLLNVYFLLDRPLIGDPDHGDAIMSLAFLAKRLAQRQSRDRISGVLEIQMSGKNMTLSQRVTAVRRGDCEKAP